MTSPGPLYPDPTILLKGRNPHYDSAPKWVRERREKEDRLLCESGFEKESSSLGRSGSGPSLLVSKAQNDAAQVIYTKRKTVRRCQSAEVGRDES